MQFNFPKRLPEANIQAEIYRRCKELDIECYLEYKHEHCRFDIVIVRDELIIGIIEVKNSVRTKINKRTRQYKKYSSYGVPLHYCLGQNYVDSTINQIINWLRPPSQQMSFPLHRGFGYNKERAGWNTRDSSLG